MAKTVADEIVHVHAQVGVRRIGGVTGDSLIELNDSLRWSGKVDWMHIRHKQTAAVAAGAEAAITGN